MINDEIYIYRNLNCLIYFERYGKFLQNVNLSTKFTCLLHNQLKSLILRWLNCEIKLLKIYFNVIELTILNSKTCNFKPHIILNRHIRQKASPFVPESEKVLIRIPQPLPTTSCQLAILMCVKKN